MKSVSISRAQRELGRLADEVNETGRAVVLTRRGRAVAQIVPRQAVPSGEHQGGDLQKLKGTVRLNCTFAELQRAVRELRSEYVRSAHRQSPSAFGHPPRRT